jgi:hypothetical protein
MDHECGNARKWFSKTATQGDNESVGIDVKSSERDEPKAWLARRIKSE